MIRKSKDCIYGKWKHSCFNQCKSYLRSEKKQERKMISFLGHTEQSISKTLYQIPYQSDYTQQSLLSHIVKHTKF